MPDCITCGSEARPEEWKRCDRCMRVSIQQRLGQAIDAEHAHRAEVCAYQSALLGRDAERAKLVAKLEDLASTWERDAKYGQTTDPASELREVLRHG